MKQPTQEESGQARATWNSLPRDLDGTARYEAFDAFLRVNAHSPEGHRQVFALYHELAYGGIEVQHWADAVMITVALRDRAPDLVFRFEPIVTAAITRPPWRAALLSHWNHIRSTTRTRKRAETLKRMVVGGLELFTTVVVAAEASQDLVFRATKVIAFYSFLLYLIVRMV